MRIQNTAQLLSVGNMKGRADALKILEAGLSASDPYYNTKRLFSLEGTRLRIGNPEFEAEGDPRSGIEEYDISSFDQIYVVGAGKGVQRVAKAIEEILGDYLTGGEVICKHGDDDILEKIGVTHGGHPVPDEHCIEGCRKIEKLSKLVTEKTLVITIISNGASSLLTYPAEGVSLDDVIDVTRLMQIECGAPTPQLNAIRNHIDRMKGGRLAKIFCPAVMVHIAAVDICHQESHQRYDFNYLMHHNIWLHNMAEGSTFADARSALQFYDVWDKCPPSIGNILEKEDPANETVKYDEYKTFNCRVFGVMPEKPGFVSVVKDMAQRLGYTPVLLTDKMQASATEVGKLLGSIAISIENRSSSIPAPAVLIMQGEMLVKNDSYRGVGGRNQECMLAAAKVIAGSRRVVCTSVDTDGTDGPGGFSKPGAPTCFSGAIVDGYTMQDAKDRDVDVDNAIKFHNTSDALWTLDSAISASQGISLNDLIIALVME